ncbi:MAG: citramalate synthase [Bacillota bacterium]
MTIGDLKAVEKVFVYDSTLRDGAQAEGISFTVLDKLKITKRLDSFGVDYIEAGNPGSNPKDLEYFRKVKGLKLKHAKLAAFGSTRRAGIRVQEDANVLALLSADTPVVAIFGKTWDFHVTDIIGTTLEENLNMIRDTIMYMKSKGKEVVFDAEHFFDGYKANPAYAFKVLQAAVGAGADWLVLCDTNGGCFPTELSEIVRKVKERFNVAIGIHCHNDCGMAVANSVLAVEHGARQVQGTFNGYGERSGNANLCTIIPNLQLKMQKACIPEAYMAELTSVSRYISEIANLGPNERDPYVGHNAFAHKGGMHIDGVLKNTSSFEHMSPDLVGNERKLLMSEVSGKSTVLSKIQRFAPWVTKESPEAQNLINRLKQLEYEGYQFEGAESSFELMVRRELTEHKNFFHTNFYKVLCEEHQKVGHNALATVKMEVGDSEEVTTAQGNGPVNALDKALRKALEVFYPQISRMWLTDYKVRVLDTTETTASQVRVHIEFTDGSRTWGTVGVSTDIIEASWNALTDAVEYFLIYEKEWAKKDGIDIEPAAVKAQ